MLKIGVTGGIGSGKTTVCKVFEILGIPVFYADTESKQLLLHDTSLIKSVIENFGADIYPGGVLDKNRLASIVFNNEEKLNILNSIVHPAVLRRFENWMDEQNGAPYVIHEAALIFEAHVNTYLDKVIVVTAPEALRIHRIQLRDHVDEDQILARIKNQWPEEKKLTQADFTITNNEEKLIIPQVLHIHYQLSELAAEHSS